MPPYNDYAKTLWDITCLYYTLITNTNLIDYLDFLIFESPHKTYLEFVYIKSVLAKWTRPYRYYIANKIFILLEANADFIEDLILLITEFFEEENLLYMRDRFNLNVFLIKERLGNAWIRANLLVFFMIDNKFVILANFYLLFLKFFFGYGATFIFVNYIFINGPISEWITHNLDLLIPTADALRESLILLLQSIHDSSNIPLVRSILDSIINFLQVSRDYNLLPDSITLNGKTIDLTCFYDDDVIEEDSEECDIFELNEKLETKFKNKFYFLIAMSLFSSICFLSIVYSDPKRYQMV